MQNVAGREQHEFPGELSVRHARAHRREQPKLVSSVVEADSVYDGYAGLGDEDPTSFNETSAGDTW